MTPCRSYKRMSNKNIYLTGGNNLIFPNFLKWPFKGNSFLSIWSTFPIFLSSHLAGKINKGNRYVFFQRLSGYQPHIWLNYKTDTQILSYSGEEWYCKFDSSGSTHSLASLLKSLPVLVSLSLLSWSPTLTGCSFLVLHWSPASRLVLRVFAYLEFCLGLTSLCTLLS